MQNVFTGTSVLEKVAQIFFSTPRAKLNVNLYFPSLRLSLWPLPAAIKKYGFQATAAHYCLH